MLGFCSGFFASFAFEIAQVFFTGMAILDNSQQLSGV